ncbi:hypothetical protein D9758_008843 [Tetrapyrgos nigripes]|uniref:PIN domain-containing protein n=1 Tax=Tetrapyrgos nigripes TaxID=182062 RepID=A0A8H5FPN8_9AGAR|nr:hypothetical protein D9758_008843 [Tetrapyrgos nigripes]
MWRITQITVDGGNHSSIICGGDPSNEQIVGPTGPIGGNWVLVIPGRGYLKMSDKGNSVQGPGDWSVAFTSSSTNWFYKGEGDCRISIKGDGQFTVSGGSNTINGQLSFEYKLPLAHFPLSSFYLQINRTASMAANRFNANTPNDTNATPGPLEEKFGTIVNDVEMQGPLDESEVFLVLDTNVLLNSLNIFADFLKDIEKLKISVIIVIPRAVLNELDYQKSDPNKRDLQWFSRRASSWIFEEMRRTKHVKGQALSETTSADQRYLSNDEKILQCAVYFCDKHRRRTVLCTGDTILCARGETEAQLRDNLSIMKFDPQAASSSRRLAAFIWPTALPEEFKQFSPHDKNYKQSSVMKEDNSMDMDVDDDDSTLTFVDARNLLHLQVAKHFKSLLAELVLHLERKKRAASDGASQSVHASRSIHARSLRPAHGKKVSEWTVGELLSYLEFTDLSLEAILQPLPRLETFLTEPYQGRGARRGQEWSPADWLKALRKLKEIGQRWEKECSILGSLKDLEPHLKVVFGQAMQI